MLKGKWKLFICIALVTCVIFAASNDVFAAINTGYITSTSGTGDVNIEEKVKDSSLLQAIGAFIYSLASLMERAVGFVFQAITNTNMFPWADAILFNAVPFLDVNIFTAAGGSLVSILYDFLTGTYYSLLTLASTFFGVAVMFSAVKLAITAIAEDKAKYKKAIVDWLLGLVMLWGMHFFISFVLYLNEQLVIVASNIAKSEISAAGDELKALSDSSSENQTQVYNFVNAVIEGKTTKKDIALTILKVLAIVVAVIAVVCVIAFVPGAKTAFATAAAAMLNGGSKIVGVCACIKAFSGVVAAGLVGLTALGGLGVVSYLDMGKAIIAIEGEYGAKRKESINEIAKELKKDKKIEGKIVEVANELYSTGTTRKFTFYDADGNKVTKEVTFNMVDVVAGLLKNKAYISGYGVPEGITDASETFLADWEDGYSFKEGCAYLATVYYDALSLVANCEDDGSEDLCIKLQDEDEDEKKETLLMPIEFFSLTKYTFDNMSVSEKQDKTAYNQELHEICNVYVDVFNSYVLKESSSVNIISNLAQYFKETAWTVATGGWKATKNTVQSSIMYMLLVCYSLVFFISYTKRLFYVIMLILMAPIVVVFDFFMKFGK